MISSAAGGGKQERIDSGEGDRQEWGRGCGEDEWEGEEGFVQSIQTQPK